VPHAGERAGATEPFRDAALYDWEYRRRRADVSFYRMLAGERGGPILDLGCGTGRITAPLVRDGHRVMGIDLSPAMLARARARLSRLPAEARNRYLLARADFRAVPARGQFAFAIAGFHAIQHLIDDRDLLAFLRGVRRLLGPTGWFAFDVFAPRARWLALSPRHDLGRTIFRHPTTRQKLAYTVSHRLDPTRRALHMRLTYQPVSAEGTPVGSSHVVRLCHRQLPPDEINRLLRRAGFRVLARWGGFAGEPLTTDDESGSEQHVYLARRDR
jgi:SAM-dependent methyltransferase